MRVSAIDAKTGIEATIVGAASAPQAALQKTALRKLQFLLKRAKA